VIRHDKSFINSVSIEKLKKSPRGWKRRAVIIHLADENNKLSQQRKISPTALVQV
jgi:hypothetical protein